MTSNLKQFRRHGMQCAELAQTARSPELATLLIELSKNWMKLANELERVQKNLEDQPRELKDPA
jgi:hypothetical protein